MKTATIAELKSALNNVPAEQLSELCIRLAKFKKENKELLTYLLFEAFDEEAWVESSKQEIIKQFEEMNTSNLYFVKKSLRKILRYTARIIRFSGSVETEVRLLLFFCTALKASGISFETSPVLNNIYLNQVKKISKGIAGMHEDLQFEYVRELELLR
jgi:hypothetical protein